MLALYQKWQRALHWQVRVLKASSKGFTAYLFCAGIRTNYQFYRQQANVSSVRYQVIRLMRMLVELCNTLDQIPGEVLQFQFLCQPVRLQQHLPFTLPASKLFLTWDHMYCNQVPKLL